jgi:hypothetical protein
MDASITRRGQPCWYKNPGVGIIAVNDSFMLESAIYHLIKGHFKQESYYVNLLELFHETTYQTEMGQLIDLITAPEDHVDLSKFNLTKCVNRHCLWYRLTCVQASTDRRLQDRLLFVLSPGGACHAYGQDSRRVSEPSLSQRDNQALRRRPFHSAPDWGIFPDPGRLFGLPRST